MAETSRKPGHRSSALSMVSRKFTSGYKPQSQLFKKGHLHLTDALSHGDPALGAALYEYAQYQDTNRQSIHWRRVVPWMENIFFSIGRHYIDDILINRLTQDSNNNQNVVTEAVRDIPRPTNDLLSMYVEPNISLLTENKPRPRVTPKSDRAEDTDAAELSELTLEYLWEALKMPQKHREIARLILNTGIAWMEVCWDPTMPRRMTVPQTEEQEMQISLPGMPAVTVPGVTRPVTKFTEAGEALLTTNLEYGDLTTRVVSPFEMHIPTTHSWNDDDMGWIMREYFTPIETLIDKYGDKRLQKKLGGKQKGWFWENLNHVGETEITQLPLWWYERLQDLVEGPGQGIYGGSSEMWQGYTVVRIFDRKPNPTWPRGRTVIAAGDKVLYDSPKSIGARAYNPRWPSRWHPYTRFRWEAMIGSVYGRSLVTKLLPKLKRVNSIDTTLIMWRRTVPISTWISPKGSGIIEDQWTGRPGHIWEFDPIRTRGARPEPVFPPPYPQSALVERQQQLEEMDQIAGTQEILRGERPVGVNSAAMIDILRKQALASRAPTLQDWDESLQDEGGAMLKEVITHVRTDPRYLERIRVIAREKQSRLTIRGFSGMDLSDNTVVRIDTASEAYVSKEAREAKAIEFLQYAPGLMALPLGLRQGVLEELGLKKNLQPQGPDVDRAKRMISWIRQGQFKRVIPFPEDDPYVFFDILVREMKSEAIWDFTNEQYAMLQRLIEVYKTQIQIREQQMLLQQQMMMQMPQQQGKKGGGQLGGGGEGG